MARDQVLLTLSSGWTQLTNADVTAITFQVRRGKAEVRFTADATAPSDGDSGILYDQGQGEANKPISDLTALIGADRVWARPATSSPVEMFVDHA